MYVKIGKSWLVNVNEVKEIWRPAGEERIIKVRFKDDTIKQRGYLDEEMTEQYFNDIIGQLCALPMSPIPALEEINYAKDQQ
jgi:hypothetical protein